MIKAVIFDMDGVMIDSNHIHYKNWSEVFQKEFNIKIPKDEFALQLGKSGKHFTEYFIEKYNLNMSYDSLRQAIMNNYLSMRENIELKEGFKDALVELSKKFKIALATGALRKFADYLLQKFQINNYFDYVIGGDEVIEAKPHPEIFTRAANYFKLKPDECVVVEDAILGIQAAKKAGMHVIAVKDEFTKYQDHSIADFQINSLHDLKDVISKI